MPQPDIVNLTAHQVLDVVAHLGDQTQSVEYPAEISFSAALAFAEARGYETSELFLDLMRVATRERLVMQVEKYERDHPKK